VLVIGLIEKIIFLKLTTYPVSQEAIKNKAHNFGELNGSVRLV
jgi:hypothetical protein